MWNYVHACVSGTSHAKTGACCQDASRVSAVRWQGNDALVLACSDGAGSASLSDVGSKVACEDFVRGATEWLALGKAPHELTHDIARELCLGIRDVLRERATQLGVTLRDLACTLVAAVVGEDSAAFIQVGDGGIVVREQAHRFRPVFWPDSGEYINTTFFLSDPRLSDRVQFTSTVGTVRDVALFTDGLQMLCLKYAEREVHEPFFHPMFHALRLSAPGMLLAGQLESFLNSGPVNRRTDDDKTLILATRPHLALAAATV